MAGDWIKLENTTPDKPEVFSIAELLGIDADAVVGKLARIWIWADQQTYDGNAGTVTLALLDRVANVSGFGDAMIKTGWLVDGEGGLIFPNFDEHNGETAKTRALTARRAARRRKKIKDEEGGKSRNSNGSGVTNRAPREEEGSSPSSSGSIFDSLPSLSDTSALFDWFKIVTAGKMKPEKLGRSSAGFRKVIHAAENAIRAGDPPLKLFRWIVGGGHWSTLKDADDLARADARIAAYEQERANAAK